MTKKKGLYLREMNGKADTDRETEEQQAATNILVQKVSSRVLDSEGRLEIDMTGTGKAWLFTGGGVSEGSWSRDSLTENTIFTDAQGQEFYATARSNLDTGDRPAGQLFL